jgi:apolipoprotein N-acyltransferase
VSHAMLVDAAKFAWMIPVALAALGAGLGLFAGLAALVAQLLARRAVAMPFALAAGWLAAEWLRGHVLTGFPWNLAGTAWLDVPAIPGIAAWVGLYGLTALTVAAAALAARPGRAPAIAVTAIFAALQIALLVPRAPGPAETGGGPMLRLVQPDIEQSLKWDPQERQRNLILTADISLAPGFERVAHVLWPETATLFALAGEPAFRRELAQLVPAGGYLITGSPRIEREPALVAWNSLHALDAAGEIRATFDKFHLVPFGEYVPLRGILPVDKIAPGPIDFSAGPGLRTIRLPGLPPFSPLICYEVIFPGAAVDRADRPDWILNVTNDGWFGRSAGPHQHFAAARFRAIEEGLPLVRVANGGISAIVDAHGTVRASLALGARTHLDGVLPPPLPPTPYARLGDGALLALAGALLGLGAWLGRRAA